MNLISMRTAANNIGETRTTLRVDIERFRDLKLIIIHRINSRSTIKYEYTRLVT